MLPLAIYYIYKIHIPNTYIYYYAISSCHPLKKFDQSAQSFQPAIEKIRPISAQLLTSHWEILTNQSTAFTLPLRTFDQ